MKKFCSYTILIFLSACAELSPSGAKVKFIEIDGELLKIQETAEKFAAKNNCEYMGFVDADPALFPGSYSLQQNEIHAALRNRAAKMGANLVVANFYRKPAQGVGLKCPPEI